jgi:hypothetical protein
MSMVFWGCAVLPSVRPLLPYPPVMMWRDHRVIAHILRQPVVLNLTPPPAHSLSPLKVLSASLLERWMKEAPDVQTRWTQSLTAVAYPSLIALNLVQLKNVVVESVTRYR